MASLTNSAGDTRACTTMRKFSKRWPRPSAPGQSEFRNKRTPKMANAQGRGDLLPKDAGKGPQSSEADRLQGNCLVELAEGHNLALARGVADPAAAKLSE